MLENSINNLIYLDEDEGHDQDHGTINNHRNTHQNLSIILTDDRKIAPNLHRRPERYLGKIIAGNEFGTCYAVGKNHFLTSGHVIKNDKNEIYDINKCSITQGLHKRCGNRFLRQDTEKTYKVKKILPHQEKDMALITVEEEITNYHTPDVFNIHTHGSKTIRISGYSQKSDKIDCENTVFSGLGNFKHPHYNYTTDTFRGTSGAPIAIIDVDKFYIVGLHTDGINDINQFNSGVLFSKNDIEWIKNNV